MVYTLKSSYDNSTTLHEMCHEFKLDIIHYEQEIFESMLSMEYGPILNESNIIYENKFTSIIGTIRKLITGFIDFIKNLFKKAIKLFKEKTTAWSKRISEFTAKLRSKRSVDTGVEEDNGPADTGVDCEYLNPDKDDGIYNFLVSITDTCFEFCKDAYEFIKYLDEKYKLVVNERSNNDTFAFDDEPSYINKILAFNFDKILMKSFKTTNISEVKSNIRDTITKKETIYSNDEMKISKIKRIVEDRDTMDVMLKAWNSINKKTVNRLEEIVNKLGKYDDPQFTKAILNTQYTKTHAAITHIIKSLPKTISSISELNSIIINETLQGYDKTNASYMKLLKAYPNLIKDK